MWSLSFGFPVCKAPCNNICASIRCESLRFCEPSFETRFDNFFCIHFQVIKRIVEISRINSWAELVHSRLICMLTNMCYQVPDEPTLDVSKAPVFLIDQVDLIGGIEFFFYEVCKSVITYFGLSY